MADKTLYLVFSNPTEGKEAEFNEWYDEVHLRDVLAIPGILTAQRYDLFDAEINRGEGGKPPTHRYLVVYEMEGDVDAVMAGVRQAYEAGKMTMSDSLDIEGTVMSFWSPRGPKLRA